MNRKCVQCGKVFTISDSELEFFKSKNLSIPKRCKECRDNNKALNNASQNKIKPSNNPNSYKSYYVKKPNTANLTTIVMAVIIALASLILKLDTIFTIGASAVAVISLIGYILTLGKRKVFIQEFDTSLYKYTFYNTDSMVQHYVKHGEQTDCSSMEDYLYKANMVAINKSSLSKRQKKDGDLVYYNPKTNEFVVIAKAGYLRTYFKASDKYYNKQ